MTGNRSTVIVVGQIARDLVLRVEKAPDAGGSEDVSERRELLGGKGANQGVGLAQLGADVVLVGVVGQDAAGDMALAEARESGLDTRHVVRRGTTALLVDVVDGDGTPRLLEHVPHDQLLTAHDVERALAAFATADTVSLQLQQPASALLVAARAAKEHGARVVLDGALAEGPERDELLSLTDVLRADAKEAQLLTGETIDSVDDARRAARDLLRAGPEVVALGTSGGDLVAWEGGHVYLEHESDEIVDPTGGGDAFVAGLIVALRDGASPEQAAQLAHRAASSTVLRLGGRPDLHALRGGGDPHDGGTATATPADPAWTGHS